MDENFDWMRALKECVPHYVDSASIRTVQDGMNQMQYTMGGMPVGANYGMPITTVYLTCLVDTFSVDSIFGSKHPRSNTNMYRDALLYGVPECVQRQIRKCESSYEAITPNYKVTFELVIHDLEKFKHDLYEQTWGKFSKEFDQDLEETLTTKVE